MRNAAMILAVITLAGCSYTPVTDLRASGDKAHLYQRDVVECKELAKQVLPRWTIRWATVVDECLEGRGHSVLNVR